MIAAADKALSGVTKAGRKLFDELAEGVKGTPAEARRGDDEASPPEEDGPPSGASRDRDEGNDG